jgi:hypothetical protein
MSPVPGKPGIGNAFVLNVNVGAADAVTEEHRTAKPSTARKVDILRKLAMVMRSLPFRSIERRHTDKRQLAAKRIRREKDSPRALGPQ